MSIGHAQHRVVITTITIVVVVVVVGVVLLIGQLHPQRLLVRRVVVIVVRHFVTVWPKYYFNLKKGIIGGGIGLIVVN